MKTLFSIVVPVYNAAASLPETLASIAAQSCKDFELILVNDGSSDDSGTIIKNWLQHHPDIKGVLIEQENQGLGAARNRAIKQAQGQWVALLDADDRWSPDKLERVATWVEEFELDIACHSVLTFGLRKKGRREAVTRNRLEDLLTQGYTIVPSAVIGRTGIFKSFPFATDPKFHGAEDLHLWIRLIYEEYSFTAFDDELTLYRETDGMSSDISAHLQRVFAVLEHFKRIGYYDEPLLNKAKQRKYYEVARFYQKRHKHSLAREYYRKARPLNLTQTALRALNRVKIAV